MTLVPYCVQFICFVSALVTPGTFSQPYYGEIRYQSKYEYVYLYILILF